MPRDRTLPWSRGDCQGGARPCPCVTCRWHLLWVAPGVLHPAARAAAPRPMSMWSADDAAAAISALPESCALDVADQGGAPAERIGELIGVSKQGALDAEERALGLLRLRVKALERWREEPDELAPSGRDYQGQGVLFDEG